jgi:hypothetical protein
MDILRYNVSMVMLITLTEKPLIRSWLYADEGELILKLSRHYKVYIICCYEDFVKITEFIAAKNLDKYGMEVIKLTEFKESLFHKAFAFLLRWSNTSTAILRKRHIQYEQNKINILGLMLRHILGELFGRLGTIVRIFRGFYVRIPNSTYKSLLTRIDCKVLLCTSLTNYYDIEILKEANKLKIETYGTPRSWDNLTSHGSLRVLPKTFLAHSEFMIKKAKENQFIKQSRILPTGTSTYRAKFLPIKLGNNLVQNFSVAIGCTGPHINPSEYDFIIEFTNQMKQVCPDVDITIIQHPKFLHQNLPVSDTFSETYFDFSTYDSLKNYYNFLSRFNLVLTNGSTIGLDALFVGTYVECFFIDLIDIGFWTTSARYNSHMPHYQEFISNLNIKTHYDIKSIIDSIDELRKLKSIPVNSPSFFTGMPDFNFEDTIINEMVARKSEITKSPSSKHKYT